jgi:hypothetical protein
MATFNITAGIVPSQLTNPITTLAVPAAGALSTVANLSSALANSGAGVISSIRNLKTDVASIDFSRTAMKNKVTAYNNAQTALTDDQIIQKYAYYIVTINDLATQGKTEFATSLNENDYTVFVPFLKKKGFTVTGIPVSSTRPSLSNLSGTAASLGAIGSNLITISWGDTVTGNSMIGR